MQRQRKFEHQIPFLWVAQWSQMDKKKLIKRLLEGRDNRNMKQYPKLPDNKQPYFISDARETKRNNICLFYLKDFFWVFFI